MKRKVSTVLLSIVLPLMAMACVRQASAAVPQRSRGGGHGSAVLSGLVLGPNDKPVPRASVSYQSSDGSAPHAVHTDTHGRFTITKLRGDNYDVRASSNGVFSEWEKNVMLRPGGSQFITLHLIYAKAMPKSQKTSKTVKQVNKQP